MISIVWRSGYQLRPSCSCRDYDVAWIRINLLILRISSFERPILVNSKSCGDRASMPFASLPSTKTLISWTRFPAHKYMQTQLAITRTFRANTAKRYPPRVNSQPLTRARPCFGVLLCGSAFVHIFSPLICFVFSAVLFFSASPYSESSWVISTSTPWSLPTAFSGRYSSSRMCSSCSLCCLTCSWPSSTIPTRRSSPTSPSRRASLKSETTSRG